MTKEFILDIDDYKDNIETLSNIKALFPANNDDATYINLLIMNEKLFIFNEYFDKDFSLDNYEISKAEYSKFAFAKVIGYRWQDNYLKLQTKIYEPSGSVSQAQLNKNYTSNLEHNSISIICVKDTSRFLNVLFRVKHMNSVPEIDYERYSK